MSPPVCLLPLAVACSTAAWGLSQQVGEAERICLLGAWGGQRTQGSQFNFPCPNTAQLLLGASMRGCGSCINPKAEGVKAAKGPSAERSHMGECGEPTVMRLGPCFKLCKSFPMPPLHKVYKPQEYSQDVPGKAARPHLQMWRASADRSDWPKVSSRAGKVPRPL